MSPRWLIGISMFLVVASAICNFIDGNQFVTDSQAQMVIAMTEHEDVQVTNPSGGKGTYLNVDLGMLEMITKALSWDYSFFHDVDPVTGLDSNSETALVLLFFRLLFICMTAGVILQLAFMLRQIITG